MTELFRIVFFTFLFIGILGFLTETLNVSESPTLQTWDQDMEKTFGDQNATKSSDVWSLIPGAGIVHYALTSIDSVISVFRNGLSVITGLLKDCGVPASLIAVVKGALFILLGVAIIKIFGNRDVS